MMMRDWNPTDDELRAIVERAWTAPRMRDFARLVLREREKLAAYMAAFGRDMNHARAENLAVGARAEAAEAWRGLLQAAEELASAQDPDTGPGDPGPPAAPEPPRGTPAER